MTGADIGSKDLVALNVTAGVDITMKDIITVAVARGELKIKEEIRRIQSLLSDLKKKEASLEKDMEKLGEDFLSEVTAPLLKKAEVFTKEFPRVVAKVNTQFNWKAKDQSQNKPEFHIEYSIGLYQRDAQGRNSGYNVVLMDSSLDKLQPKPTMIALAQEITQIRQQIGELTKEGVEWKYKLSDIPSLERQMSAKIVETQLSSTEKGKAILESMLGTFFDDTIKMIGSK